ncbi:hypothetical protein ABWH96_12715 [Marivirga tractuosa]|uniref:hypothetical protein n=1 Tax=Marivirga tractuosa TaxID=1006 RepID=UPI0035CEEA48
MGQDIIIKLKENTDLEYALQFLKHIDFVKKVASSKINEYEIKKNYPFIASEKSLAEDWLSEEDDRWDELLNN